MQALPCDEPFVVRGASDQSPSSQKLIPPHRTSPPKEYLNSVGGYSPSRLLEMQNMMGPNDKRNLYLHGHMPGGDNSLDNEVNFQYLKHVVMKFMLSRESEVSDVFCLIDYRSKPILYCI